MDLLDPKASPNGTYVSTGALPPVEQVRALVAEAHERFATVGQGQVSQVYPALARVDPALFGICVVDATGGIVSVGQAGHEFTIMSVSKPFVFALVCDLIGATGAQANTLKIRPPLPFSRDNADQFVAGFAAACRAVRP